MLLNRKLLAKILAMTTSDNDGEALNAVRMANTMVKEAGETWEQVLAAGAHRAVTVTVTRHAAPEQREQAENWQAAHLHDKLMISTMFRHVFAMPRTDNEEFWQRLEGIHHWFETHGSLSQKQYQMLRTVYNTAKARG